MFVGLHNFHQVILADGLLAGRILFLQPLLQHFRRGLQVDDEMGRGELLAEIIEVAIVGIQLLIVEVEAREQFVFFEDVIGNDGLVRARAQIKRAQLLEAPDQECELGLEARPGFAIVERFLKCIVFRFDDALGGQALSKNPRQRAFPNAYGTFDRNVTGKLEKLGHRLVISDWRLSWRTEKAEYMASPPDAIADCRTRIAEVICQKRAFNLCNLTSALCPRLSDLDLQFDHAPRSDRTDGRCCRIGGSISVPRTDRTILRAPAFPRPPSQQ